MKALKRFIALATVAAMFGTSAHSLNAAEYCYDTGGCGYEECRQAPCLTPAIALGAIALIAIIAVAVQNSSHHGHGHSHS
ncbi:MAG: hypothetical protein H0X51_04415 [Parachlamydiaceae bacterium]|nr:hypothetical protein [Parachlamydiaceae bacterium]